MLKLAIMHLVASLWRAASVATVTVFGVGVIETQRARGCKGGKVGHYELMSEMALGRRREGGREGGREGSGRVMNRYRKEEGERRERKAELAQLLAGCRRAIIRRGGWEGMPEKKENKKEDEAKGKEIRCDRGRCGQYGGNKVGILGIEFHQKNDSICCFSSRNELAFCPSFASLYNHQHRYWLINPNCG